MGLRRRHKQNKSPRGGERPTAQLSTVEIARRSSLARYPAVYFVVFLGLSMGAFMLAFHWWIPESSAFRTYLNLNARAAALALRLFGEGATTTGTILSTPQFSLQIKHGCDALPSTAFLWFAILAVPIKMPVMQRLLPILIGTAALAVLNVLRILTLYYVGAFAPGAFEWVHIDLWQAIFVFAPLVFWLAWLQKKIPHQSGNGS